MNTENKMKLTALGVQPEVKVHKLTCGAAEIDVYETIPYEDVFDMIQWSIDYIADDRPFISEPVKWLITDFALLKYYTNLDVEFVNPETDTFDIYANYDFVKSFELPQKVAQLIDKWQLDFYYTTLEKTLASLTAYKNSALGIVDQLVLDAKKDGETLKGILDATEDDTSIGKMVNLINAASSIQNAQPEGED